MQQEVSKRDAIKVLVTVSSGNFVAILTMLPVAAILPAMAAEFGTGLELTSFVMSAYLLVVGGLVLIAGRLGDSFGHGRVFAIGMAGFVVALVLCGLARNIWELIAIRALQGTAAALIFGTSLAIVTIAIPVNIRGRAIGVVMTMGSLASAVGVALVPFFLEYLSWRWVFFLGLPFAAIGFVTMPGILKGPAARPLASRKLDAPGSILFFLSLSVLSLSFSHLHGGEQSFQEGAYYHSGMQVLAVTLLVVFLWVESKVKHPLLDVRALRNGQLGASVMLNGILHMTMLAANFMTPFYVQGVLGLTPGHSAAALISLNLLTTGTSPVAGYLQDRTGSKRTAPFFAALLCGTLLTTAALLPYFGLGGLIAVSAALGIAMGMLQTTTSAVGMAAAPVELRGLASGLLETTRQLGHALAVAIAAAVLGAGGTSALPPVASFQLAWLAFGLVAGLGVVVAGWRDLRALPAATQRPAHEPRVTPTA